MFRDCRHFGRPQRNQKRRRYSVMAYTLSRASPSDIPGMVDVWYTCFKSEFVLSIVPKSTTGFKWLSDSFDTNDPNVIHMVMTDDSQDPRRVVAFSRWVKHNGGSFGEWHSRWKVELPADMTEEKVGKGLFEPMHRQHLAAMGERAHYCDFPLSILFRLNIHYRYLV